MSNPMSAVTLAGGAIYLLVFESYRAALAPFGVNPSEVGISYSTAIWPATQVLLVLLIATLLASRLDSEGILADLLLRPTVSVPLVAVLLYVLAVVAQSQFIYQTRAGSPFQPIFAGRFSVLAALQTTLATASWKDGNTSSPLPSSRLLFLGSAAGTALIYEVNTQRTWRLPSADVVIQTSFLQPQGGGGLGPRPGPPR